MSRLPYSRQQKSTSALYQGARPYIDHSSEGLRTQASIDVVYPSSLRNERAIFAAGEKAHTLPKSVNCWPPSAIKGDCLHCGDALESQVYPVAKYKADTKFWIFGQFCTPSCALGYVREMGMGCQVEAWTRSMLSQLFGITQFQVCPPRFCLKKYGGGMEKILWKDLNFASIVEPPLSTFAMFAESIAREKNADFKSVNAVRMSNLQRPEQRDIPLAVPTCNGREPFLLKLLAESSTKSLETTTLPSSLPVPPIVEENIEEEAPTVKTKKSKKNTKTSQMLLDCS
jgi:hypothetical protein